MAIPKKNLTWALAKWFPLDLSTLVLRFEPNIINKEWGWKKPDWVGTNPGIHYRGEGNSVGLIISQKLKRKRFLGIFQCHCTNFTAILSHRLLTEKI